MCTAVEALRRNTLLSEWLAFATQVLIAISAEVGDDLGRGLFSQHGTIQGIDNAQRIAAFEMAHGFWLEPAWQLYFAQTHHILGLTISWPDTMAVMNGIYVLGHVCVTLGTAVWVYVYRRQWFRLLRNTVILTNLFALFVYESFPVAPPRLTTGLIVYGRPFTFQDTLYGVTSGGRQAAHDLAYNEFSAMPSVHMAWALVVGITLVWLARPWLVKALGALYPALMLVAVVVTGNHYLLDAVGAVFVVLAAVIAAFAFERWWVARTTRIRKLQMAT